MFAMMLCIGVTGTLIIKAVQLFRDFRSTCLPIETNEVWKSADDSSESGSMVNKFSAKR